jgi:subtilase family serine protease
MKTPSLLATSILASFALTVYGAQPGFPRGSQLIPETSLEKIEDIGIRSHTNHVLLFSPEATGLTPTGVSPQSIRQVYGLPSTGGAGIIAIVDAYHYPTALNDFNVFAQAYGLPVETSPDPKSAANAVFQVVYANGAQPALNEGWSQEAALDIEWAHAMAPGAKIILVEAASNSNSDLYAAVAKAGTLPGVKEISMSWGGSEFHQETQSDSKFQVAGIVYFASSGDTGGKVIYPGCSPYAVSAGGTTLNLDANGNFVSESGWRGGGGGNSRFESRPSYQNVIQGIVGKSRGVPDYSFDADPNSGVSVYDSTAYNGMSGWMVFGGTSVSAPSLAGIVNSAAMARGTFQTSSPAELSLIYTNLGTANFRDITLGSAGTFNCTGGWDFVTGVGSTLGQSGK